MLIALLGAAAAFLVVQTLSLKKIRVDTLRANLLVNGAFSGVLALCLGGYALFARPSFSPVTLGLGCLFGALFIATVSVYYYAMQCGPLSYTVFFFSASMLIPAVAGILFFRERPAVSTLMGVLLFLGAFYLISVPGAPKEGRGGRKWLILALLTWALNGSLAVVSKTQQTLMGGEEVLSYMLVSFTAAALSAGGAYLVLLLRSGEGSAGDLAGLRSSLIPLLGAAAGTGGGNIIITYLSSRMEGAYLFPLVQGSVMILVTLYSLVFLKERISKIGAAGILLGLAGIVVINL